MDWLSRHGVVVECKLKKVTLGAGTGSKVVIWGERLGVLGNLVSAVIAKKMIRQGCETF